MTPASMASAERPCPVCGASDYVDFADERLDRARVNDFTYSSRKQPEYMCHRLVRCESCNLVYAVSPPSKSFLSSAYETASYDSTEEAQCAADTYASYLKKYIEKSGVRHGAADIGAGSGPFLPWLVSVGYSPVIGVEPSRAAVQAAPDSVRSMLKIGMFEPEMLSAEKVGLVCSFMTLEHIDEPAVFAKMAYELLEPGGMMAIVVHNRAGALNRLLGMRSPIIDIEHLQLFDPASIRKLLDGAGFRDISIEPINNRYPLRYWIRLVPLPNLAKRLLLKLCDMSRLSNKRLNIPVGNLLAVGVKPVLGAQ